MARRANLINKTSFRINIVIKSSGEQLNGKRTMHCTIIRHGYDIIIEDSKCYIK